MAKNAEAKRFEVECDCVFDELSHSLGYLFPGRKIGKRRNGFSMDENGIEWYLAFLNDALGDRKVMPPPFSGGRSIGQDKFDGVYKDFLSWGRGLVLGGEVISIVDYFERVRKAKKGRRR